jgi:hypothetical protein
VDLFLEVWYLQFFWVENFSTAKETFEKRSILPAQLNPFLFFNRGSRPSKAKILTTPVRSSGLTGQAQELNKRGRFAKVSQSVLSPV